MSCCHSTAWSFSSASLLPTEPRSPDLPVWWAGQQSDPMSGTDFSCKRVLTLPQGSLLFLSLCSMARGQYNYHGPGRLSQCCLKLCPEVATLNLSWLPIGLSKPTADLNLTYDNMAGMGNAMCEHGPWGRTARIHIQATPHANWNVGQFIWPLSLLSHLYNSIVTIEWLIHGKHFE